ncbi:MAG: glycosyltransferase family 9 protein [Alphaproteobacteria bacterium]
MQQNKILIIKFGGLGDVMLSLNAMYSIFKKYNNGITLLTEKPFDSFLKKSDWFEEIVTIKRSLIYSYDLFQIKKKIKPSLYRRVFDLQTSKRSSHYLKIFDKNYCEINGIGKHVNIPHDNPNRNNMHTIERQKDQLKKSKINFSNNINFKWLEAKNTKFFNLKNYVLLVPGGSGKRLNKRIPVRIFYNISEILIKKKIKPVLIGSDDDYEVCAKISRKYPAVLNLCQETSFFDVANLAQNANFSIGNDTGPMHIISRCNKKTIVFFTTNSDPNLCRPIGKNVETISYDSDENIFCKKIVEQIKLII